MYLKRVYWNQFIVDEFKRTACLTETEERLLELRVKEYPNSMIADMMGMSKATLHRALNKLLAKYNDAQAMNPKLPKARKSEKEIWMDNN